VRPSFELLNYQAGTMQEENGTSASPAGETAQFAGKVKWFNPTKGFGFVEIASQGQDAFLHVSALSAAGVTTLHPGAEITVTLSQSPRGVQVERLISVESEGEPQYGGSASGTPRAPSGPLHSVEGTVKFYNARKGFGFVTPDDGGPDIFLPGRVLTRCGILSVNPDDRLLMQVRQGMRGLAAESVELASGGASSSPAAEADSAGATAPTGGLDDGGGEAGSDL
jgi:CspA family cold shock protein